MDIDLKIEYDGEVYHLDLRAVTLKQAMVIQGYMGMSIQKLFELFTDVEEDTPELLQAIGAVYWLMMNQAGKQFPIGDTDFPLVPFLESFFTALLEAAPAEPEPGPEAGDPAGPTQPPRASSASPRARRSRAPTQTPNGPEEGAAPADTTAS